ncbi:MAG TPA: hypothetical protein VEJ38_03420 [Candidatus Acidoferrales bacterium]|nr:hypothetical protein [Candidatus Acidoferrales bacterium]
MRTGLRLAILWATIVLCAASHSVARKAESAETGVIACRVMEAHTSANPAATVIVFHQQHKEDGPRLGAVLGSHSGERMEIQAGGAAWTAVTIFRLRSCFGRGLMVLPPGAPEMKDGATFLLRIPGSAGKN